ncbi:MAG TPA: tRNA (guanosine(37)-N1)-methyltransferase TrmD [Ktedonobacterales bacterium]|nr:tRNA (guanosine(37)-N1)-methyltransferase TrmD [Ktedonobacterales bacterium]
MRFDIFTLFPEMFRGPLDESILARARERGLLEIALHNPRDVTTDRHHIVDDYPYGGGAGMVMKPEPLFTAVEQARVTGPIILLSPQGRVFSQQIARELATEPRITLICGHYEGVDERVREHLVTDEISLGDFVLTGGELAAMVLVDAVARLLPGVLAAGSTEEESHTAGLLEYPHYTRPAEFRGWRVPEMLLSGNHAAIARWRRKESLRRTRARRPDLFALLELTPLDRKLLAELDAEAEIEAEATEVEHGGEDSAGQ